MMYQKALLFNDHKHARQILGVSDPHKVKMIGRQVRPWNQDVWDRECVHIVAAGNLAKFTQNPELLSKLLDTGNTTLVEASPYDATWGVGLAADDPNIHDPRRWRGRNLLGVILTELREFLKAERDERGSCNSEIATLGRIQGAKREGEPEEDYRSRLRPRPSYPDRVKLNSRRFYASGGEKRAGVDPTTMEVKRFRTDEQIAAVEAVTHLLHTVL